MSEKFSKKIFVFDVDGTLADSMEIATKTMLSFLDERGISYPDDLVKTLTPLGYSGVAKYYEKDLKAGVSAEEIFAWITDNLQDAYATKIPLKERAKETLLALKGRGIRLCVLTGSPHRFIDPCLKRAGVYDLFERVWSADDFGLLKGDPAIFSSVAKELGVGVEDLLVIDDGINVVRAVKKAGAYAVGVYDECTADDEAQMRAIADGYVHTLAQLL